MKYQLSRALWHPAPIELIGPEKVHELHPLLNMDMVSYELTTALLCYYNIAIAQQLVNCKWNIIMTLVKERFGKAIEWNLQNKCN